MAKKLQVEKESKPKVELTWIQAQLPRDQWDSLNARRLALKLTWGEVLVPAALQYMTKLDGKTAPVIATKAPDKGTMSDPPMPPGAVATTKGKATDASTEAAAVTTIKNKAPEKSRGSKSKRVKKSTVNPEAK